jgi:hypothetical protein
VHLPFEVILEKAQQAEFYWFFFFKTNEWAAIHITRNLNHLKIKSIFVRFK